MGTIQMPFASPEGSCLHCKRCWPYNEHHTGLPCVHRRWVLTEMEYGMAATASGIRAGILVSTEWLAAHLDDPDMRIVDMRGQVATSEPEPGVQKALYRGRSEDYATAHIPGAIYLDWTRDIVDPDDPVPAQAAPADQLAALLGARGIGDQHTVVVYDDSPTFQFATRLWWLLHLYGHDSVYVLDGGLPKWQREGRPLTTERPQWPPASFTAKPRPDLRVDVGEMLSLLGNQQVRLMDARDERQYNGTLRRSKHGGHIPGAINIPREALIDPATGTFRDDRTLAAALQPASIDDALRVVAYCNGGVAATSVLFALALHGYPLDRMANYDGSWNEWGNRDDVPVRQGDQP
jgi:thiosulfate/3-mercaptopyruvate sulfurtransferase